MSSNEQDNFSIEQFTEDFATQIQQRFLALDPPMDEEMLIANSNIIHQFIPIAYNLVQQEEGITVPGSDKIVPYSEVMIMQVLTLFAEGLYHTQVMCFQLGVDPNFVINEGTEQASLLIQQIAMDLYNQTKQVVISTIGQEHTPELQFSHEQQVNFIHQTAESTLMLYINELGLKTKEIEEDNDDKDATSNATASTPDKAIAPPVVAEEEPIIAETFDEAEEEPEPPAPVIETKPIQEPAKEPLKGPTRHDKYAAVALLLGMLPDSQKQKLLTNFSVEELELIEFYKDSANIKQNLDIPSVKQHLDQFKSLFKTTEGKLKSEAYDDLTDIVTRIPEGKLINWLKEERPRLRHYIKSFIPEDSDFHDRFSELFEETYTDSPNITLVSSTIGSDQHQAQNAPYLSETLPPKIEAVLHEYIQESLEATEQSA